MSDDAETEKQWDQAAAMVDAAAAAADENRLAEALELARTATTKLTQLLGIHHPDAANARLTLGRILQRQQRAADALSYLEQASSSLLACEDPDDTIHNLALQAVMTHAHCLLELGRFDDALVHAKKAFQLAQANFGQHSTQTAWALNLLGMLGKFSGRFADAEKHYAAARPLFEALYGPTSRELATLLHNIGGLEHARGNFAAGEPPARQSVEIGRQVLPPDDPELVAHEVAHAALLDGLERHAEAAEIYRRAVDAFTGHFGREHYEVASTLHNLGAAEHALGNTDAARAHYDESIALMAIVRGLEHPDVALTQYNLAVLHRDAGRTSEAKGLFESALATFRTTLGDRHPNTIACVEVLAALP
jgi:tetratricopeptide (TPR) repeat protein